MRKFANLIAPVAAVAALSASSAYAADLPYSPPPSNSAIYAPAPVYNWTGFYVGASAGYGWGTATASTSSAFNISPDGGLVGGQIGYNYQLPNNLRPRRRGRSVVERNVRQRLARSDGYAKP